MTKHIGQKVVRYCYAIIGKVLELLVNFSEIQWNGCRWFNSYDANIKEKLYFDLERKLLKSTAGIRVIEVRDVINEMVLLSWTFTGRIRKFSFAISSEVLNRLKHEKVLVVAEDNVGNILKENMEINSTWLFINANISFTIIYKTNIVISQSII